MATMHGTVFRQTTFAASGSAANVLVVLSQRGGADGLSLVVPYFERCVLRRASDDRHPRGSTLLQKNGRLRAAPQSRSARADVDDRADGRRPRGRSRRTEPVALRRDHQGRGGQPRLLGADRLAEPDDRDDRPGLACTAPSRSGRACRRPRSTVPRRRCPRRTSRRSRSTGRRTPWPSGRRRSTTRGTTRPGRSVRPAGTPWRRHREWDPVLADVPVPQNGARYPATDLGIALAQSARLIRADVGAEVITVDHPSWDMHTDIGTLDDGDMRLNGRRPGELDRRLLHGPRLAGIKVTLVTISEFGRRVEENGDAGADHGWGNAMLVFGAGVKGGSVITEVAWPRPATDLEEGDLKVTIGLSLGAVRGGQDPVPGGQPAHAVPGLHARAGRSDGRRLTSQTFHDGPNRTTSALARLGLFAAWTD